MKHIKLCQNCKNNRKDDDIWGSGYISWIKDDSFECPVCQHKLVDTVLTGDEEEILSDITRSASFYDSMIDLKQKDPIEFQLKMSQFKTQLQQQESSKQTEEANQPHCPTCGSTDIQKISGAKRWFSTGLFGLASSDIGKSMCCKKCGYKW